MASFWTGYALPTAILVGKILAVVVPLLLVCAYYTYAERKVLAYSQLRKGPNVVGPFGLLQPIADALKMLMKETVVPSGANRVVFIAAPIVARTFGPSRTTSYPATVARPAVGGRRVVSMCTVVDLPAPFGPRKP